MSFNLSQGAYSTSGITTVPFVFISDRPPTANDINFPLGQRWIDQNTNIEWALFSFSSSTGTVQAVWHSIGGQSGDVNSLTGDDGLVIDPDADGNIDVLGSVVANATHAKALFTENSSANTMQIDLQLSAAIAATDVTKVGLAAFDETQFNVDANGFVTLQGGGTAIDSLIPNSGTSPVVPNASGQVDLQGASNSGITTVGGTNSLAVRMNSPYQLGDFSFNRSESGAPAILEISNTSNTAASDAKMNIQTAGSSSGDPYVSFGVTGVQFYALGTDNTGGSNSLTLRYGNTAVTPSSGSTAWTVNNLGVMTFNEQPVCDLITINDAPVIGTDGANKAYVDSVAAGLLIKAPCYAGTTANLNATYANGAAGVGATLTNAGAMAAFSVDGVSPPISSRILVKDQTTTFENGIYDLTTVGSGAVNWVLTRSTDYDTPAEILPGDFVIVENGTVNANTGWVETATVTTIGVDAILFSRLGGTVTFPITIAEGGTNATSMASTNGINYFDGTRIVTAAALTDGQLLIGNTSDPPTAATLTAGTGIAIVNGAGSITISSSVGQIFQYVNSQSNTYVTCSTTMNGPFSPIPINTEGDEVLTLSITPISATNLLVIKILLYCGTTQNVPHQVPIASLFQDAISNALISGYATLTASTTVLTNGILALNYTMVSGTTMPIDFSVRMGPQFTGASVQPVYLNGSSAGAFNAAYFSSIEIWEVSA